MFQEFWNDLADIYDALYPRLWCDERVVDPLLLLAREVGGKLSPAENLRILDVSCGTGHPSFAFCKKGFRVECSDGSPKMLERLVANFRSAGVEPPPLTCCTWHELPSKFPAGHFDVLLCLGNSICHLPPISCGAETALRNFLMLLRPGGLCFIDAKKYNSCFEELNFNRERTNLAVRWYRVDDHPAPPGGGKPCRFHYLSEYNLDAEHRYTIEVLEENLESRLLQPLGTFEFWPVGVGYLTECFKRLGCPSIRLKDMRLTKHKYDLLVARKKSA